MNDTVHHTKGIGQLSYWYVAVTGINIHLFGDVLPFGLYWQNRDYVFDFQALYQNVQRIYLVQGVQLKSEPYFNMSDLFTKIYNILYYTTNLYLQ